jgi:hypothetical protein
MDTWVLRFKVLSRCLKCQHVQELLVNEIGVYGICVNQNCQRSEEILIYAL